MTQTRRVNGKWPCPRCSARDALEVGQANYQGTLRWYESVKCHNCGLRSEADGEGFPPEEFRDRLLQNSGRWEVRLDPVKSPATVAKVVRTALSLSMQDAAQLLKQLPGSVYVGTEVEAAWLAEQLAKAGESPMIASSSPRSGL